jgi:hypothetical protein
MSPEERERMFELCRLIDRETDPQNLIARTRSRSFLVIECLAEDKLVAYER